MTAIPIVELRGGPRQRGRAHGEELRPLIHEMVEPWVALVERVTNAPIETVVADFSARTTFDRTMAEHTPELLDELAGMAEGAAVAPDVLFMYNCTDESDWYLRHRRMGVPLPEPRGCSSLAVADSPDGVTRIAQNMDIPSAADGRGALLHLVGHGGPEAWVFTVAGLLGIMGMNAVPVAAANNALRMLSSRPDGLPVNAVVRGVLACADYDAAVDFIRRVPHASGQAHLLGTDGRVDGFECSAAGAVSLPSEPRTTHTNHPLVSSDLHDDPRFQESRSGSSTVARLASLQARVRDAPAAGFDALVGALAAHDDPDDPVCRHSSDNPGRNYTAASVVYELGEEPAMHLAPGPPCRTPMVRLGFEAARS